LRNQKREADISTEVELKLSVRAADLPALKRELTAMTPVSAQERLISTYYDTPDSALKRRGLTLRVREQGGQFTQTVKAGDSGGDIPSRGEWEDAVAENRPDPMAAQSGPRLPQDRGGEVQPVFVTEIMRTSFQIEPGPEAAIEAAIDEGEIRAIDKDKRESVGEIELELKRGDPALLYDLAFRLLEVAPIRIETRSKSERGYRLAEGGEDAPAAVHAEPVTLDPEMTVEAALEKIGKNCIAQLLRNEPAVLSAQSEGVHQMRVAVRRLRSAISSLKNRLPEQEVRRVTGELRWLGGMLGPARNLDVFAAELLPAARIGLPNDAGWDELADTLCRLRRAAYHEITKAILSDRYTPAILGLLRWFEASSWRRNGPSDEPGPMSPTIIEIVVSVLDRRRRNVRQRSNGFDRLAPPERHKLRIAVKKLRYTTEIFESLFDEVGLENFVRRLKRLQSDLGYANDVRVAHEFVVELFARIEPRSPSAHAWVALLEAHDQRVASGERKLRRHLRQMKDARPFWCE